MNLLTKYKNEIALILLGIAFIPYIYLSFFTNPICDDFISSVISKENRLFPLLIKEYNGWSGRYGSNVFVFSNPLVYDSLLGYKLAPIAIILGTMVSFFIFIKGMMNQIFSTVKIIAFACLLTLLFLYQMPVIADGIYWYTGAVTYQLGNIFLLMYIGFLNLYFRGKYFFNSKYIHGFILAFILFFVTGFNEILMVMLLLISTLTFFIVWKNRMNQFKAIARFLFIVSILCSIFMCLAPGNTLRGDFFPEKHQLVHSLAMAALQTLRFFTDWISSAPLILLSVLYYFINKELSSKHLLFSNSFYLSPILSLLLLFFVIFIGSFPAYWATGILGQHRTMNASYFLFILMWFINLTVFYNKTTWKIDALKPNWEVGMFLVIWISLIFSKNGFNALEDITKKRAYTYNKGMEDRYASMQMPQDTLYFKPFLDPPKTLFVLDITEDPDHWINQAYNVYFETDHKIILKK